MVDEPEYDAEIDDEGPLDVSSDRERERAVLEVLRLQREREAAQAFQRLRWERERRRKRGLGLRHAVFLLALVGTVYVFSGSPLWLQAPPPGPSVEHLDASLRLSLYLQGQRVETFRQREGRLPESLAEVGGGFPEIRYSRTDRGTYHLAGVTETHTVFYSSSSRQTAAEFLDGYETRLFPASFWEGSP